MAKFEKNDFVDDLTFKPELYSDLLNPPLQAVLGRLEVALNAQKNVPENKNIHCKLCQENVIFRAPQNHEVKLTQFSKFTQSDMDNALLSEECPKYGSHSALMKLVNEEQDMFESFLTSLKPKFSETKAKLPSSWFQFTENSFKEAICEEYGGKTSNFRVCTTHLLNGTKSTHVPSIEKRGQIICYGKMFKIKLPKLGHQIKKNIDILANSEHNFEVSYNEVITNSYSMPEKDLNQMHYDMKRPVPLESMGFENETKTNHANKQSAVYINNNEISPFYNSKNSDCNDALVDVTKSMSEGSTYQIGHDMKTSVSFKDVDFENGPKIIQPNTEPDIYINDNEDIALDCNNVLADATNSMSEESTYEIDDNVNTSFYTKNNDIEIETEIIQSCAEFDNKMGSPVQNSKKLNCHNSLMDAPCQISKSATNLFVNRSVTIDEALDKTTSETPESGNILDNAVTRNSGMKNECADHSVSRNPIPAANTLESEHCSTKNLLPNNENDSEKYIPIHHAQDEIVNQSDVSGDKVYSLFKHVKVAISHDLDVFITDVPVDNLKCNVQTNLSHDDVKNFLLGLKVAEVLTDVDSLCHIFSSFSPNFVQPFLFKISVSIHENRSKNFKISSPLPQSSVTAESISQDILKRIFIQSCPLKEVVSGTEANITFLEYLLDCGAQLIDRGDPSNDVKSQVKDFIEPLKFTSFLEWKNINSNDISDQFYSLFSLSEMNMIVHTKQPYFVNFNGSTERATIYIKPQYCYEYGFEILTESEVSSIYLKALLSDCVGVIIIHIDMARFIIVHKEYLHLDDLSSKFSKSEAISRLKSFFDLLNSLKEGNFVYSHESCQPHSVIYEELKNEHIQADLSLNQDNNFTLSTYTSPVQLSRTQLTSWQRHNRRLPLCYNPRRAGTYLCHEYLSKNDCSNIKTCAFAHLSKKQLEIELGPNEYEKFMKDFTKPKEEKVKNKSNQKDTKSSHPNFGKIMNKRNFRGKNSKRRKT